MGETHSAPCPALSPVHCVHDLAACRCCNPWWMSWSPCKLCALRAVQVSQPLVPLVDEFASRLFGELDYVQVGWAGGIEWVGG